MVPQNKYSPEVWKLNVEALVWFSVEIERKETWDD